MKKAINPAKAYLMRYRALILRQDSLIRAIDAAHDRAYSITAAIGGDRVQVSARDRMADDIIRALEATEQLIECKFETDKALAEILQAINAVADQMGHTILLMRYVEGLSWRDIQERTHYEKSQVFIIHGKALWTVNRWLEGKK